jgi:hypothetical protein
MAMGIGEQQHRFTLTYCINGQSVDYRIRLYKRTLATVLLLFEVLNPVGISVETKAKKEE